MQPFFLPLPLLLAVLVPLWLLLVGGVFWITLRATPGPWRYVLAAVGLLALLGGAASVLLLFSYATPAA